MNFPLKNIILFLLLIVTSCKNPSASPDMENNILRELEHLKTGNLESAQKRKRLGQLYNKTPSIQKDSLKNQALLNISFQYLLLEDSVKFRKINNQAYKLALKRKDSNQLALAYWDLAVFYYNNNIMDSAYHFLNKTRKIYELLENPYRSGRALLDMAIIQKNIHDYTGSEVATIKAISFLKPLEEYWYLYRAYNNLGIVYKELEEYDKSFSYYQTAGEYLDKTGRKEKYPSLWNNIGVMFKNGKRHDQAAEYFNKALSYKPVDIEIENPELYAMLLDNRAHNRLKMKDTIRLLEQFDKALAIRKKEKIVAGIIVSRLHLAEYFLFRGDSILAIRNALRAKELAMSSQDYRDMLASLLILSRVDRKNSLAHSQRYIQISDSLQQEERETRNKFARIRYETAGYIAQTKKLSDQVNWILLISAGITTILTLVIALIIQNFRNKKRILIHQGRENEKKRIARELHDGIVGKLYGARINLDAFNENDDKEVKKKRFHYIQEIQKLELEIRSLSHELDGSSPINTDFESAVRDFASVQSHGTVQFEMDIAKNINFKQIEANIKLNLYRIIQEAVHNVHKHAHATKASIIIQQRKKQLILNIKDNGKGFDHSKTEQGIGLGNIRARAKDLRGKLKIDSNNHGTTLILNVPIL